MSTTTEPRRRLRPASRIITRVMFVAAVVAMLAYAVFPIVWTALTSLKRPEDIVTSKLQYFPAQPTIDNFVTLLATTDFARLMFNSVIVTLITVALCVPIGGFAAYSLSRQRFRGRGAVMLFFLSIRMFPAVLLLIPIFMLLRDLHLLDTPLGLALTYTTFSLPIAIWFMKGFFDDIPGELEDAAFIDGCSRIGTLFRIVVPLAMPGIGATAILVAIGAWNEFIFALMITSSTGSRTWPVGLQLLVGEFQLPYGQLAAGAIVSILPIIVAYLLVGRTLVSGLMAGGLKG